MAMDINSLNNQGGTNRAQQRGSTPVAASKPAAGASSSTQASSEDTVHISAEARLLAKAAEKLGTDTPVNREKVEALKTAISDGSYKPDAANIAARMMAADQEAAPLDPSSQD